MEIVQSVLVGPFNEHLLTAGSRRRYQRVKSGIPAWLRQEGIPHAAPPALPSAEYGDASHPLAAGYRRLAGELVQDAHFRPDWRAAGSPSRTSSKR